MNNLFLLSAEEYADEIKKYFQKKGVKINLEVIKDHEPRYVFRVIVRRSTNTTKLRNCIEDLNLVKCKSKSNKGVKNVAIKSAQKIVKREKVLQ